MSCNRLFGPLGAAKIRPKSWKKMATSPFKRILSTTCQRWLRFSTIRRKISFEEKNLPRTEISEKFSLAERFVLKITQPIFAKFKIDWNYARILQNLWRFDEFWGFSPFMSSKWSFLELNLENFEPWI